MAESDRIVPRSYFAKDFESLRADFAKNVRLFLGDRARDLSASSVGGLLVDTVAAVGDSMSFYLDHQFGELDPQTVVEPKNIERMLRAAGIKQSGASAATVQQTFFFRVPAKLTAVGWEPDDSLLPIVRAGAVVSDGEVDFVSTEELDFSLRDSAGKLRATARVLDRASDGSPKSFSVAAAVECVSGRAVEESFSIGAFTPYRQLTLSEPDVTLISSVSDSDGNVYWETTTLADDVVYELAANSGPDSAAAPRVIVPRPAPYRYVTRYDVSSRATTLVFGGGSAAALSDDAVPDPVAFALPLKGRRVIPRLRVTPERLLRSRSLGVAASNVSLTVSYRAGGGLSHNSAAGAIGVVKSIVVAFPRSTSASLTTAVKLSVSTSNVRAAEGGEDPPTLDDLREVVASARASQDRIVTVDDLVARIHSMPSSLGRVFRVGVSRDPGNPLVARLHVVSRDASGKLVPCSDSLKRNVARWLNPYRLIADAYDVYDASIVNLTVAFEVALARGASRAIVLKRCSAAVAEALAVERVGVGQSLSIDAVRTALLNVSGVSAVRSVTIGARSGTLDGREYPGVPFDPVEQERGGEIKPPIGGVFEVRWPEFDIAGVAL